MTAVPEPSDAATGDGFWCACPNLPKPEPFGTTTNGVRGLRAICPDCGTHHLWPPKWEPEVCGAIQHEPVPGQPHFCIRTPGHFPATKHGDYSGMEWTETEPPETFVVP